VDKAVETFIYKRITEAYPEHKLCAALMSLMESSSSDSIGEETYKGEAITDDPTWIVE